MKKIFLLFILIVSASSFCFAEVSGQVADPSEIGVGARSLALGKSFVGVAGDASGMFINPAGLADIGGIRATSMSGQLLSDFSYFVIGGASPTQYGTVGIGIINVGLPSIPVTSITGSGTTAEVVPEGVTDYYAYVAALSYSNDLSTLPWFKGSRNIAYGVNFKYFMQGFSGGGSALRDAAGTGFDMDIGLQYRPRKELSLGLSAINILPESLGGKFTWQKNSITESIPAVLKAGCTAKLFGKDSYWGGKQNVFLGLDFDMQPVIQRPSTFHLGVEWWPISIMAVRAGLDQAPAATESGNGVANNYTAGIGLRYNGFTFDYCYHQFNDLNENVTHFFSLGYVGTDEVKWVAEEKRSVIPVVVPAASLETFSDVPQGFWAKSPIEFMATMGVMNGFHDGLFRPDDTISRAELAAMLIKLKNVDVNEASSDPYPDVSKDHWAAKYIKAASYLDIMRNYPDGTFKPNNKVTRVEGVVILSRFTEAPNPGFMTKDPFVDVPRTHWAAGEITSAQQYGLLDYLNGKKFDPNRELTRAEVAEMLSKTAQGKDRIRKYLQMSI